MDEMEYVPLSCNHQETDDEGCPFNYCPWCGKKLLQTDDQKDDCIKGGCLD